MDGGGPCELVCGRDTLEWTREELRRCVLPGFQYTAESPPYLWLLDVLAELPDRERHAFLEFVAVCPRLPPGGLSALPRGPIKGGAGTLHTPVKRPRARLESFTHEWRRASTFGFNV